MRPRRAKLYAFLPARTPGIEELSQAMITAFVVSAVYSVLFLLPVLYWTSSFDGIASNPSFKGIVFWLKLISIGLCAIATLAVGIVPQTQRRLCAQPDLG